MFVKAAVVCMLLAAASLVGATVARIVLAPFPLVIEARQFFQAADTLLLFVIAMSLVKIAKSTGGRSGKEGE